MKGVVFISALIFSVLLLAQSGINSKRIVPVGEDQLADFQRETKLAVVVGVGSYPARGGLTPIEYATRDAQGISAALRSSGYTVATILDAEATASVIRQQLGFATAATNPNLGTVLFFFCGHGFETFGRKYLATYDSVLSGSERSGLSLDETAGLLKDTQAPRQMLWIDANRNETPPGAKSVDSRSFNSFAGALGVRFLFSAQPGQYSYKDDVWQTGVFAHYLIQGLQGEAAGPDGLITSHDISEYVISEIRNWSVQHKLQQTPYEDGEAALPFLVASVPKPVQPPTQSSASVAASAEMKAWSGAKDSKEPGSLETFLQQFPDGVFAPLAKQELAEMAYLEGQELMEAGSFASAQARFDRALLIRPNHPDALHYRARVEAALGKMDAAIQDIDQSLKYKDGDAEIYFDRGSYLFQLNKPGLAIESLRVALKLSPGFPGIRRTICQATSTLGNPKSTEAECQKAVDADSSDIVSDYFLAESLKATGQLDKAVSAFDEVLRGNPNAGMAYRERGWAHYLLGHRTQAAQDMDEAVRQLPEDAQSFFNRATLRGDNNQINLAMEDLQRVIALNPKATEALKARAGFNALLGNLRDAMADVNSAIELGDHSAAVYASRARIVFLAGKPDDAFQGLSEVLRSNPDAVEPYQTRADVYTNLGDLNSAEHDLDEVLRRRPDDPKTLAQRGLIYARKGDHDRADADLSRALVLRPNDVDILGARADAYDSEGDFNHALEIRNRIIEIGPDNVLTLTQRSLQLVKMNRGKEALPDLDKALRLTPGFVLALVTRAVVYAQDERYDKADADADNALAIAQEGFYGVMAWLARGSIYEMQKRWVDAIGVYTQGLGKSPRNQLLLTSRASCWTKAANPLKAIEDYSELLVLHPLNAQFLEYRGALYSQTNHLDLAMADYSEILRTTPDDATAHANRAMVYGMMKSPALGLTDANEALRLNPNLGGAWGIRAQLYADMDKLNEAIADLSQAIKLDPENVLHLNGRAWLLERRGERERAIEDYTESIRLNPDNEVAWSNRGNCYFSAGKPELAIENYDYALRLQPNNVDNLYNRGRAHALMNEDNLALKDFTGALQQDATLIGVLIERARVYGRQRRFNLAQEDLSAALRQNGQNLDVLRTRAEIDELVANPQALEADYRRILEVDPKAHDAMNSLAYALAKRNIALPEAYSLISRALEAKPDDGEYQDTMAWVLYRMDRIDDAEKYERLALGRTESFEIHDHFGDILLRGGRIAEAIGEWQAALKIIPSDQDQPEAAIRAKLVAAAAVGR